MKRTDKKYFIAAVKDDYINRIEEVADALKAGGCEIKQVLYLSGIIIGKVDKTLDLNDLKVEGIASVENQRTMRKK
jgi:hypothetical protein